MGRPCGCVSHDPRRRRQHAFAEGYATIGAIGFEGRVDYGAIGTVTNLASRLCGEAAGGQILVSARVAAAVEDLIEADEIGAVSLKGLARLERPGHDQVSQEL